MIGIFQHIGCSGDTHVLAFATQVHIQYTGMCVHENVHLARTYVSDKNLSSSENKLARRTCISVRWTNIILSETFVCASHTSYVGHTQLFAPDTQISVQYTKKCARQASPCRANIIAHRTHTCASDTCRAQIFACRTHFCVWHSQFRVSDA